MAEQYAVQGNCGCIEVWYFYDIYQELNPVPYMTVADNIFLGREPLNGPESC